MTPVAGLQKKVKSTRDRESKKLSVKRQQMPQLEIRGQVFQARVGGGGERGLGSDEARKENIAVFGDASSHNPTETHKTTQRQVNTSSANRSYRGNDQKQSALHPRL